MFRAKYITLMGFNFIVVIFYHQYQAPMEPNKP